MYVALLRCPRTALLRVRSSLRFCADTAQAYYVRYELFANFFDINTTLDFSACWII